jgi:hypothetical protein
MTRRVVPVGGLLSVSLAFDMRFAGGSRLTLARLVCWFRATTNEQCVAISDFAVFFAAVFKQLVVRVRPSFADAGLKTAWAGLTVTGSRNMHLAITGISGVGTVQVLQQYCIIL